MSFADIIAARKAAALLATESLDNTPLVIPEPTEAMPMRYWKRGTVIQASPTRPGFGWQPTEAPKAEAEAPTAPTEAPEAETPVEQPDPLATLAAPSLFYWVHRTSGEVIETPTPKKPSFIYREATPEEIDLVLRPAAPATEAARPSEPTDPQEAGFRLDSLVEAFEAARFTREEALEERDAIARLLEADPSLAGVLADSPVPLNANQLLAASYAKAGKSFVLTGAAGTGKTTAQAATIDILDKAAVFGTHDFKYIGEAPSIAIVAFTKVAVRNIQKAIRKNPRISHYANHCMTIHSLIEFEPVIEERRDDDGLLFDVRVFKPQRNSLNPLGITHLIIEEASMVGLDLFKQLADALLPGVQIVYLGDINQLQPVFSNPILAYALVKLPVIELTRVYRQALDNPIIANAHAVLRGEAIKSSPCGKVSVLTGNAKVQVGQMKMASAFKSYINALYDKGWYDPEEDQIILPWGKQFLGTKEINESVASYLGVKRNAVVQQVLAGRWSWWLAVGDKLLVDKRMGVITAIDPNPKYVGRDTAPPGLYARNGTPILGGSMVVDFDAQGSEIDYATIDLDQVIEDEGSKAASHVVKVQWLDTDGAFDLLSTCGQFADGSFDFAYAMTCHKAQGSEWRKVIMAAHKDHLGFLCREFMYTALTRAREEFLIFIKEDVLEAACRRQDVKGDSLQDKIAYFTSGALGDLDQVEVEFPAQEVA